MRWALSERGRFGISSAGFGEQGRGPSFLRVDRSQRFWRVRIVGQNGARLGVVHLDRERTRGIKAPQEFGLTDPPVVIAIEMPEDLLARAGSTELGDRIDAQEFLPAEIMVGVGVHFREASETTLFDQDADPRKRVPSFVGVDPAIVIEVPPAAKGLMAGLAEAVRLEDLIFLNREAAIVIDVIHGEMFGEDPVTKDAAPGLIGRNALITRGRILVAISSPCDERGAQEGCAGNLDG
jgi:hypothetical protein